MSLGISALKPLEFEWDKGNIDKNWKKHRVTPEECEEVFSFKDLKLVPDLKHSQEESRFVARGETFAERKLTVIFTVRKSRIRVISAHDQSRKERKVYEKRK